MAFKITRIQRLSAVISISICFFVAEISVGFYTHSLALIADAFHYLSDVVGFIVALVAAIVAEKHTPPKSFTFGWQRAQLLGAFFNGVLLFGLGISVFLQSIERFVSLELIEEPKLVLIMGCIGLGLNIISITFLHDHDHGHSDDSESHEHTDDHRHGPPSHHTFQANEKHVSHKHTIVHQESKRSGPDLAMMGVFIHVLSDAGNNLGVIIAALVISLTHYGGRYYADPAVSMGISLMILASSIPLIKRAGSILLQSAPDSLQIDDVKHDIRKIPGVVDVHELHIWRLDQKKTLASAHLVLADDSNIDFNKLARTINECFHAYGIHSITLQPELVRVQGSDSSSSEPPESGTVLVSFAHASGEEGDNQSLRQGVKGCQLDCGSTCGNLSCCQ